MTQAPSIKEALKPCPFCNGEAWLLHGGPGNWFVQCTQCKCTTNDVQRDRAVELWNTRATFQPDGDRREAIARIKDALNAATVSCSGTEITIQCNDHNVKDAIFDGLEALAASGLVQNEAGIRADEREKLRNRLDSHLNDFLCGMKEGWDDSVSGFNDAWDVVRKVFDAAAIRSARDGGAET